MIFTIGYGGRRPPELLGLLTENGIKTVVDVRLRPDCSSMGFYAKRKSSKLGIEHTLGLRNIDYVSLVELGNPFKDFANWRHRYQQLLSLAGDLLTERLQRVNAPFCLMCAEKRVADCHREEIARHLMRRGHRVEHIL